MSNIKPFKISIPDSQISDLKQRLSLTRFPDELDSAGWSMGAPLADIKRLAYAWQHTFDWKRTEERLNQLPQFTAPVTIPSFSPLNIHFLHARSSRPNAIPLLFLHGWPGSFLEATKILPLLTQTTDPNLPSFHAIAPSLPNFGFSSGVSKRGFGLKQHAQAMHELMLLLGYSEYVVQGGDWGSFIARIMGRLYPSAVKTVHINMPISSPQAVLRSPLTLLRAIWGVLAGGDWSAVQGAQKHSREGAGYMYIQDTKPQTLGYGLTDSPVGLLGWIYEKLVGWTDGYEWTEEEILTWISIYWFSTAGPAASLRIYYESTHPPEGGISRDEVMSTSIPREVPVGIAYFPRELFHLPKVWNAASGRVVHECEFERGGHFAAWEVPELLVGDLRKLFGRTGACMAVVKEGGQF